MPKPSKREFDIGTAAHSLLLEGIDSIEVIDRPDWRTKEAQAVREHAYAIGKTPLLTKDYEKVHEMIEAADRQIAECEELSIRNMRTDGDAELSYIWQEGDIWIKTRPDWRSKDRKLTIDYKTTGTSANPNEFVRRIIDGGYDIQDALYRRGIKKLEDVDSKFVFVVQETEPPYLCSFISLSPMFRDIGEQKVDYGMFLWSQCLKNNSWPGYPNRVCYPDLPAWASASWELRAQEIGI